MELHRIEPERELDLLREFLAASDPQDYLLDDIEEWVRDGRLWAGVDEGSWVAFGRVHDLGHGQGWVSGLRVAPSHRGRGVGGRFLDGLLADARAIGLTEVRAVIDDGNRASRQLFTRHRFRPVLEMTLRRAPARRSAAELLRPATPGDHLTGPVGWIPGVSGRADLLPGSDGGRLGRWDPRLPDRWVQEHKLYLGPCLAAAVQVDWQRQPRTMWVNPLQGEPASLFPALTALAAALGQDEWQAYLPSTEPLRRVYADLGLTPHAHWGDRIHLYERAENGTALT